MIICEVTRARIMVLKSAQGSRKKMRFPGMQENHKILQRMVPAKACLYLKLRETCSTHICLFGICLGPSEKVNERTDLLCWALCCRGSTLTTLHSDHPPAMSLPTEQGAHLTKDTSLPKTHDPSTCRRNPGIWNLSFVSKGPCAASRASTGPSSHSSKRGSGLLLAHPWA